jgi:pSer/pThr/pTyr-binding forkhead associated (FHA) protein
MGKAPLVWVTVADHAATPHATSPAELKAQIEAERAGLPFVVYRDGDGRHRIVALEAEPARVTVGRRSSAQISLNWDEEVSRLHAELARVGEDWTLSDDGLSLNGSFVNGRPVHGNRRLRDGDSIRLGNTVLLFRDPTEADSRATAPSVDVRRVVSISESQRRVLLCLCKPFRQSAAFVTPPTNDEIAGELSLSVDAVKKHLRILYERFGVDHLPQNEKRARLVERALAGGFFPEEEL